MSTFDDFLKDETRFQDTPDGDRRQRRQDLSRGSAYADCVPGAGLPEPETTPDTTDQQLDHPETACQGCGSTDSSLSARRTWGDNNGILWRCPQCASYRQLHAGAGARTTNPRAYETRTPDRYPGHAAATALPDGGQQ